MKIEADKVEYEESPFDAEFVKALIPKLNYEILSFALGQIVEKCKQDIEDVQIPELPENIGEDLDEELLKKLHTVLFDLHVVEGHLICPDTGRRFAIKMGIPNMVLHADEM